MLPDVGIDACANNSSLNLPAD